MTVPPATSPRFEASLSLRSRYRASIPLLASGTYAAIVTGWPFRSLWPSALTLSAGLLCLWLSPLGRRPGVRIGLGIHAFLASIALDAALAWVSGGRLETATPALYRAAGWVAYALSWGGLVVLPRPAEPPADPEEPLGAPGLVPLPGPLAPRSPTRNWPAALLTLSVAGLAALMLWPAPSLPGPKLVLLRTLATAFSLALLGLGALLLGDAVLPRPLRTRGLALGTVGFLSCLCVAVGAVWALARGQEVLGLGLAVGAAALLGMVLRLRRFPRTKIEL